jgi:hypothetical protein
VTKEALAQCGLLHQKHRETGAKSSKLEKLGMIRCRVVVSGGGGGGGGEEVEEEKEEEEFCLR